MKSSNFRLVLSLTLVCVVLPSLLFDVVVGSEFEAYREPLFYGVSKILVWFLLPFTCLAALAPLRGRVPEVFWLAVFYLNASTYFYLTNALVYSLVLGLIITYVWKSTAPVLERLAWGLAAFAAAGLAAACVILAEPADELEALHAKSASAASGLSSALQLKSNVYVLLFDELSRHAIYRDGTVHPSFPNFKRLESASSVPPRSTTNYPITEKVLPTVLSGKLFEDRRFESYEARMKERNLFDMLQPDDLSVWSGFMAYCGVLRSKGITAACIDPSLVGMFDQFQRSLEDDFRRFVSLYSRDLTYAVGLKLTEGAYFLDLGPSEFIRKSADFLHARLQERYYNTWRNFFDFDRQVVAKLLGAVGAKEHHLYFYHSSLAHAPFVADKDLNVRPSTLSSAFHLTRETAGLGATNAQYLMHVQAADTVLGMFLDTIAARDPESIVIVLSDHGAQREIAKTQGARNAGYFLADIVDTIFFIMLPPDHPLHSRPLSAFQTVDFLPTFLDAVGAPIPDGLDGVSAFSDAVSPFFYRSADNVFRDYESPEKLPPYSIPGDPPQTAQAN